MTQDEDTPGIGDYPEKAKASKDLDLAGMAFVLGKAMRGIKLLEDKIEALEKGEHRLLEAARNHSKAIDALVGKIGVLEEALELILKKAEEYRRAQNELRGPAKGDLQGDSTEASQDPSE